MELIPLFSLRRSIFCTVYGHVVSPVSRCQVRCLTWKKVEAMKSVTRGRERAKPWNGVDMIYIQRKTKHGMILIQEAVSSVLAKLLREGQDDIEDDQGDLLTCCSNLQIMLMRMKHEELLSGTDRVGGVSRGEVFRVFR